MKTKSAHSPKELVLTALFTAVILLMAFTPLGLIDLPIIKATILHVPVIIGSILLGPRKGAWFGALFGLTSLWKNTMTPSLLSFAFSPFVPVPGSSEGSLWALAICLVPRLLVGIVPWFVCRSLEKLLGHKPAGKTVAFAIAGLSGSAINTGLVMGLMGIVLPQAFAAAQGIEQSMVSGAILSIVLANGIPEAIAAVALTSAVCLGVSRAFGLTSNVKGSI